MTERKPTNPKDAVGIRKAPMSVVPAPVIAELGVAMLEGARKYGRHNYRAAGVRASVYYDAAFRHLASWWEGEDLDPDSQLSHVTKAIATLTVLRDSMLRGNWVDDRPPKCDPTWIARLNEVAGAVIDRYPNAEHAYTALEEDADVLDIDPLDAAPALERPLWFTDSDEDWIVFSPIAVISRTSKGDPHLWVNSPRRATLWRPEDGFDTELPAGFDHDTFDAACHKFWDSLDAAPDTVHDP